MNNGIVQDLRYGIRQLVKNPGFTAISVLTLALGIGINASMFSMVSGILIRRPPGYQPDRIGVVAGIDPASGFQSDNSTVSIPTYLAWRDANTVFQDTAAADEFHSASLTNPSDSESVRSAAVTANYFNLLGVSAELGRTFSPGEDQSGQDREVILSHELWERRFGADRSLTSAECGARHRRPLRPRPKRTRKRSATPTLRRALRARRRATRRPR